MVVVIDLSEGLAARGAEFKRAGQGLIEPRLHLIAMERAELIDELLNSFDTRSESRHFDTWQEEAESRIDAFEAGRLTDDAAEAVFARINRR